MLSSKTKKKTSKKKKGKKKINEFVKDVKKRLQKENLTALDEEIKNTLRLTQENGKYHIGRTVNHLKQYYAHKSSNPVSNSTNINIVLKKRGKSSLKDINLPHFSSAASKKRKVAILADFYEYFKNLDPEFSRERLISNLQEHYNTHVSTKNEWYTREFRDITNAILVLIFKRFHPASLREWIINFKNSDKNILQALIEILDETSEDDSKILVDRVLSHSIDLKNYSGNKETAEDKQEILEKIVESLKTIKFSFAKNDELVQKLVKNTKALIDTMMWVQQNPLEYSSIWYYIENQLQKHSQTPVLDVTKDPEDPEIPDPDVAHTKFIGDRIEPLRHFNIPRNSTMHYLSTIVDEITRLKELQKKSSTPETFNNDIQILVNSLNASTLSYNQAKELLSQQEKTNGELFKTIAKLVQLTSNMTHFVDSEEAIAYQMRIKQLLNIQLPSGKVIRIPSDRFIGNTAVLHIIDPTLQFSIFCCENGIPNRMKKGWSSGNLQVAFFEKHKVYPRVIDTNKHANHDRVVKDKHYLESLPANQFIGNIKAFMKEKLSEYLYLPEFDNNVIVGVFKTQLDSFIDKFLEIANNQSSNTKSFLLKVMRFLIMFMLNKNVPSLDGQPTHKYKFKITYVTGSINKMESGSIFRSQVLQKRLTPQNILESTLDDKFPLLMKFTKYPDTIRSRIHTAIDTEKDHLLQILLISIDTTAKWIPITAQPSGDNSNTNNIELHMSCYNKNDDSVLYLEYDAGKSYIYCFDLPASYSR